MTRLLLILPLSACMHTPCPVPLSCVTPEDCVCLVTGAVDTPRGGDGGQGYTPTKPDAPDNNGGGNGGHSNGGSSDGGSDDSNGGKSDD